MGDSPHTFGQAWIKAQLTAAREIEFGRFCHLFGTAGVKAVTPIRGRRGDRTSLAR